MSTMSMARSTPAQNPRGAASQSLRVGGVMLRTLAHESRPGQSPDALPQRIGAGVAHAVGTQKRAQRVLCRRGVEREHALPGARTVGGVRVAEPCLAIRGECGNGVPGRELHLAEEPARLSQLRRVPY